MCVLLVILIAGTGSATEVTLPHTQNWNTLSPWTKVYSGGELDGTQSAPGSASSSFKFTYPSGMPGGSAPDKIWVSIFPTQSEFWTQYYFKYSSNFYFHPGDNKQAYWSISGSKTNYYVSAEGQTPKMRMVFQRTGSDGKAGARYSNTGFNPTIQRNTWYKLKTHVVLNTGGSANGVFQMWINDQLVMDYDDISYLVGSDVGKEVGSMEYTPVFGGGSDQTKPATDFFWVDYTIISGSPSGSGTSPPPPNSGMIPSPPSKMQIM